MGGANRAHPYGATMMAFIEKCGLQFVGYHRMVLIQVMGTFFMFCATTFFIVGCFGLSDKRSIMNDVSWTKYHTGGTTDYYMNLVAIRSYDRTTGAYALYKWDDNEFSGGLNDCKDAATTMQVTIIISTVTAALQMPLCFTRGSVNNDSGCYKLLSMITGLIAVISHLIALGEYGHNCYRNADDNYHASYEVGFILPLVATILGGVVWILFVLCPCPDSPDGAHPSPKSSAKKGSEDVETVQNPTHSGKSAELEYSMEEVHNDDAPAAVPTMQNPAHNQDEAVPSM